jgi:uncharacterized iron-regulated membrane protein
VTFFEAGHEHGDVGLDNSSLFFDGKDSAPAGSNVPGTGSAGDILLQEQFPLHSGRILGLPGRIFISVAALSVTGVIVWQKNRWVRRKQVIFYY